jgi:outer membrane immunogenic protein
LARHGARPGGLVFASGGVAYGGVSAKTNQLQSWSGPGGFPFGAPGLASSVAVGEQRTVKTGWTAGAGVEWMITPNWSLKAEYLYFDLGSIAYASSWANTGFSTFPVTAGAPTLYAAWHQTPRFDGHILRAGVKYHFNWGAPAAVLAKF